MADGCLIALFLTAICLPASDALMHLDPIPASAELAPPPPPPRLDRPVTPGALKRFLGMTRKYVAVNFGFRRALLRLSNLAEFRLFGRFSTPDVIPGKDGWLIFNNENNLLSTRRYRSEELERWRIALEWRRDWCRALGVPYLLVFAPKPLTTYPETLSDFLTAPPSPSPLGQLIAYLAEKSDIDILDLRPAMRAGRSLGRIYHRTDTHWNELGAYLGYREIMARLARRLPGQAAAPLDSFDLRVEPGPGGDLARMMALGDVIGEDEVRLVPRTPRRARSPDGGPIVYETICPRIHPLVITEVAGMSLPRAVMVRDSYGSALVPLLSEHFSRISYRWRVEDEGELPFPVDLIEREHPDVVIDQYAERMLQFEPPKNPVLPGPKATGG